jgi:Cd2+/Zn2+-exporting ATPase
MEKQAADRKISHTHAHHNGDGHQHPHPHPHKEEHAHTHSGIFGEHTELIFSLVCGALLVTGFALSFSGLPVLVSKIFYGAAYIFGGFYTAKEAIQTVSKGGFEIDFLMLVAAIGAAVLGEWGEGALLLFLFSLGHALEHYAMGRARKSITALTELAPKTATLKNGELLMEVPIEKLKSGDIILVRPGSKIAADGLVIKGNSSVNQAPITGESIPVDKFPVTDAAISDELAGGLDNKFKVFAGTINGANALEIRVTRAAADSTISRLIRMVNEAQNQKSPTQLLTDKLQRYYVPAILILVVLLQLAFLVIDETYSESFYRSMAVLVAASPCALAISTPSAVLSGVARAARAGLLIKGGRPLEELGSLHALAFDKTGTLTKGQPELTGVYSFGEVSEQDLLRTVVAVEQLSDHPLAKAIVKAGKAKLNLEVAPAQKLESTSGRGVHADLDGNIIKIGNREFFKDDPSAPDASIIAKLDELEANGNTSMLVQKEGIYIGVITVMDTLRNDASAAIEGLRKEGIRRMVMLSGDNQAVATAIAGQAGIREAFGNLLPEQKVQAIEKLKNDEKKVAMIGDGINDAPAMAKSSVGIAMGAAGSDVALETADVALMSDQLSALPFAVGLSKKAHRIIKQNLLISLGMVALLIPLTILGIAPIGPAVAGHEGSTLLVVINALRLLAYK